MKARHSTEVIQGFTVHTLETEALRLSLVPELGGRIVSLHDRRGGREWLEGWEPESARRLWQPTEPGDYLSSPMAGIDECLPTVLPCQLGPTPLPDHGDLWEGPCDLDETATGSGILTTSWRLQSLPLTLTRTISLDGNAVRLRYELTNLSDTATPFLWAWHPLFTLEAGDAIHFGEPVTQCRTPEGKILPWPEAEPGQNLSEGALGHSTPPCAKVFVGPLSQGRAEIRGQTSILSLVWTAALFPWAGIWINKGALKDLHHWAIEPTNCPVDRLSETPPGEALTLLQPREIRRWEVLAGLERP